MIIYSIFISLLVVIILQVVILLRQRTVSSRIHQEMQSSKDAASLSMQSYQHSITQSQQQIILQQEKSLDRLYQSIADNHTHNIVQNEQMQSSLSDKVRTIQQSNDTALNDIRVIVEEKLDSTLNKRISTSFKLVSDQLETVYKGLGEMQNLAHSVGDLKKILGNVKTYGIWGETQLGNLVKQILPPSQYIENAAIQVSSQNRVEYAVKLPGYMQDTHILLPIDAKFPLSKYDKLLKAYHASNIEEIAEHSKNLEISIKQSAADISKKYICPPFSTDFAIMFIPIEGLYAEILKMHEVVECVQQKYRVIIAGPTTLTALLNSLQIGLKTITIQKKSGEIWTVLDSIKNEFKKFSVMLNKTKAKLDQASKIISEAEGKSRVINQKFHQLEQDEVSNGLDAPMASARIDNVKDDEEEEDVLIPA